VALPLLQPGTMRQPGVPYAGQDGVVERPTESAGAERLRVEMFAMAELSPDAEIAVPALGSDQDGFRQFYESALPRVYGYLLRRCESVSVAEDLVQETFLAAVLELRKRRAIDAPMAWIFGIARHKLLDHYRRLERRPQLTAEDEMSPAPAERDDRVLSALAAVPPSQRIALVLRHADGLSVSEVAATLGRSVEAVESLLSRGRSGFRRAYGESAL
jgi:RNA polymerase sigma-70 factor, ECF subfamily